MNKVPTVSTRDSVKKSFEAKLRKSGKFVNGRSSIKPVVKKTNVTLSLRKLGL